MRTRSVGRVLGWPLTALIVSGCSLVKKAPPAPVAPPVTIAAPPAAKAKTVMTLSSGADSNPNREGRPSPVVVRVYQLKVDTAFTNAAFEPLFDDDKQVLADGFVTRDEFTLTPGERRVIEVALAADTRFVGVVAAFRDIANAEWRAVVPAPRNGLSVTVSGKRVAVRAE
jgi:type VI secretion system protein VasD